MKKLLFVTCLLIGWLVQAQQEPHYTQYMYNMSIVNPAYMINEPGLVEAGLLYRSQWVGMDGSPETANVFANIPLTDKIELGVNYMNDQIGDNIAINENLFNIDAAYKIKLKENLNLSFGIKLGIDNLNIDFSNSNVTNDPYFENGKKTVFNIGTGAFLFSDTYYVGLSSPNLIPGKLDANDETIYQNDFHVFLIGGYVFEVNDFKIKPSTVVKMVSGSPLSFDVGVNGLYMDRFELGAAYRYQDAITAMAGFYVLPDLRLGYAYDFNTSRLKSFNNGTHEFILTYRFDVVGLGKKYNSPRFY